MLNGRYLWNITNCLKQKFRMSLLENLENERKQLSDKVHILVDKLESTKQPDEIKVPKEAVIKSKEEEETNIKLEKLAIKEEEDKAKKAGAAIAKDTPAAKPAQAKGQKGQSKRGGAPEPEAPIDITRLDLRIGKILDVSRHPDADSLYVEKISCGDASGEPRTIISGLVKYVPIDDMKDRNVVVLCNLKPVKMRGILSEGMVMCASTPDSVEPLNPPSGVEAGQRLKVAGYDDLAPDAQLNPKKKVWEQVSVDLKTNDEGIATYKGTEFHIVGCPGKITSSLKNVPIR